MTKFLSQLAIFIGFFFLIGGLFSGEIGVGIFGFICFYLVSLVLGIFAKGGSAFTSWRNEKRELRQRQLEELRKKQTDQTDLDAPDLEEKQTDQIDLDAPDLEEKQTDQTDLDAPPPIDHKSEPVPDVQSLISKMTDEQKLTFESEYNKKSKSVGLMVFLSIFFPIQFLLLGKIGLQIVFFLTAYGFGLWWIIEWFKTPGRVKEYNEAVAMDIAQDILK